MRVGGEHMFRFAHFTKSEKSLQKIGIWMQFCETNGGVDCTWNEYLLSENSLWFSTIYTQYEGEIDY